MSSSAKTEQPTPKKKLDASKKGQIWRSQDLITVLVLFGGVCLLRYAFPLTDIIRDFLHDAENGFRAPMADYLNQYLQAGAKAVAGIVVLAIILSTVPSLLMSRFRIGSEAVKLDFSAVNPINGLKKLFSLRTLKDAIKACLYLLFYILAARIFWSSHRLEILGLAKLTATGVALGLADLAFALAISLLGATLVLTLADALLEYKLYIRDLKMTREEVKREHKDQFGAPQIKRERQRLGREMLSGEVLGNVENSNFILANPTHIAIGIYINSAISILPFISVMEIDERAQAVLAHARDKGIPIVRNIPLARRIFKQNRCYSFISEESLDAIGEILLWLVDVEKSRQTQYDEITEVSEDTLIQSAAETSPFSDTAPPKSDTSR